MFSKRPRAWLSDANVPYPADRMPRLYDPLQFDFVKVVEAQWETIRDELLAAVRDAEAAREFKPYQDLEKTDKDRAWKTAGLMYWTVVSKRNTALFPRTWEIFRSIPNVTSCSLHLLEPRATIKPHIGDTDAMLRCHMGLVVPAPLPRCGFRVGQETIGWEEGKVFIFNDAQEHTAWNNTDQDRYVISFDVMRPEYVKQRYWIASQVLGKIHVEVLYQHVAWLKRWFDTRWAKAVLFPAAKAYWRAKIWLRNELLPSPLQARTDG
jgi:aspartyl/asparaginyl beta-hydroxylase (cupin superfamily)